MKNQQKKSLSVRSVSIYRTKERMSRLTWSRLEKGLTIVELMVAMTLGLAILAAVGYVYVAGNQGYRVQDDTSRMQEDARYIIQTITRDIQMAGHFGCARPEIKGGEGSVAATMEMLATPPVMTAGNTTTGNVDWLMLNSANTSGIDRFVNPALNFYGFKSTDAASSNALPTSVRTGSRLPETDVLLILRGGDDAQPVIEATNTTIKIPAALATAGPRPLMVVGNCSVQKLIKPSITATGAGRTLNIDNSDNKVSASPAGLAVDLGEIFGADGTAVVSLFSPVVYYIAPASVLTTGPVNQRLPQLRRMGISEGMATPNVWDAPGDIVANGVESLNLWFDLLNPGAGTITANTAMADMTPNDWGNVVTVRGTFSLVSTNDGTATELRTRRVGGIDVTDRRLQQTYSFAAGIRSKQGV
jgi:Tfp pilus assembly protein PilW